MARKAITAAAEFIGVSEAAKLLKLAERSVRQHAANGTLAGQRLGERAWLFRRADVLAFRPRPRGRPVKPTKDT